MELRPLLEQLESARGDELLAPLAYLAAQLLDLEGAELSAARRRALLVLVSGGDPRRELTLDTPAVGTLAAELDGEARREELAAALARLRADAEGLPMVAAALDGLAAEPELALRWLAAALLAEELGSG